jgi:DNA polymerase-1
MLLNFAKKYLYDNYTGMIEDRLEADDLLGILGSGDRNTVIWSIDKDLLTIPAFHLIDGRVVEVSEKDADYMFLYQTLVGDSTDNYKGCPKVGAKRAEALLKEKGATWKTVVDAFTAQGLSEQLAVENARLARILRDGEYNFKTKKVRLWMA